jgi:peptide-methionine (S)-S-oxide reductase
MTQPRSASRARAAILSAASAAALLAAAGFARADAIDKAVPAPALDSMKSQSTSETAILAGGCFWGMQGVFEHVKGVQKVVAGYSGGAKAMATYDQVTTETTGHAESISVTFDPRQVSYGTILRVYFSVAHDPTELNYQGPDEGTSYRSEIFAATPEQMRIAQSYIAQLGKAHVYASPIVTKVETLKGFYPAEAYHQDFLINHPTYPYIVFNDLPKIAALKGVFPALYLQTPVKLQSAQL